MTKAETLISKARRDLMLNPATTYWAVVSLHLQPIAVSESWWLNRLGSGTLPTICTDGQRLFYHPPFIESLTRPELEAILVEETAHCALGHPFRCDWRNPQKWNIACDAVLHEIFTALGYKFPEGGVFDGRAKGLSAETFYQMLPEPPPGGGGSSPGSGLPGLVIAPQDSDGHSLGDAAKAQLEQEWRNRSIEALRVSKAAGTTPGGADRIAENIRKSRVPWQEHLQRFFAQLVPFNFTWHPIDKRFAYLGMYLPGIERRGVGQLGFGVDLSGSIGQTWLDQCSAESNEILMAVQPEMVHVAYFDSVVQTVKTYGPGEPFTLSGKGGGGTDFRPPFEYFVTLPQLPMAIIMFTDLCCNSYPPKPDCPVLWITDSMDLTPPFGDVIRLEVG